jgi:cytochrome d ubiquinol oxidase subunit II
VAAVFLPVVIAYQAWTYWVFRRRLDVRMIPDDGPRPRSGRVATDVPAQR